MWIKNISDATINRSSPIPLYAQLKQIMREQIEHGSYKPGDRIPSELEFCHQYGVSRIVVRQALSELTQEGLIIRQQGLGSFVSEPKINESLVQKLTGFFQDMVEQGITPHTEVLRQEITPSTRQIAARLQIDVGASVLRIDRVRSVDEEPIIYVTTYLPASLCPGLIDADLSNQSLYAFLENECLLKIDRVDALLRLCLLEPTKPTYWGSSPDLRCFNSKASASSRTARLLNTTVPCIEATAPALMSNWSRPGTQPARN